MLPLYWAEAAEASHQHKPTCILLVDDLQIDLCDVTSLEVAKRETGGASTAVSHKNCGYVTPQSRHRAFGDPEAAVQVVTPSNRHQQRAQQQLYRQRCQPHDTSVGCMNILQRFEAKRRRRA